MKFFPVSLIPSKTHFRFMETKWLAFALSLGMIAATFFLLATRGLNFGIDFTGGTVIEVRTEKPVPLEQLRATLGELGLGEVALQHMGGDRDIMIRLQQQEGGAEAQLEAVNKVKDKLSGAPDNAVEYRKVDVVGPVVGQELIRGGAISLALALLGIMIYVWVRFEWQFGLCTIAALFHDVIVILGLYSLLHLEFNLTSVAAILTVIGYSVNDSVVIFDRIRENLRKYKSRPLEEILNNSINDTLSRTIVTGLTTIAVLVALVYLGGDVIYGFSLAVLVGVIVGTYSSIYIGAPLLIYTRLRNPYGE